MECIIIHCFQNILFLFRIRINNNNCGKSYLMYSQGVPEPFMSTCKKSFDILTKHKETS